MVLNNSHKAELLGSYNDQLTIRFLSEYRLALFCDALFLCNLFF